MKKLIALTLILFTLALAACSNNQSIAPSQEKVTQTTSNDTQSHLKLMLISDEGYHFESTTDSSGAFIPLSEANNYHVSNLSEGDNVTMVFNDYGDILEVNDQSIN